MTATDRAPTLAIVAWAIACGAYLFALASHARSLPQIDRPAVAIGVIVGVQMATWLLWSRSTRSAVWMAGQTSLALLCFGWIADAPTPVLVSGVATAALVAAVGCWIRRLAAERWRGVVQTIWIVAAIASNASI